MTSIDKKRTIIAALFLGVFFFLSYNDNDQAEEDASSSVDQVEGEEGAISTEIPDATVAQTAEAPARSSWIVNTSTSAIDDSRGVIMTSFSSDTIRSRFGQPRSAKLVLRCRENTTSLFLVFAGNHMTDHQQYGRVTVRIDDQDARTLRMNNSTDNRALGLWRGGQSIPVIRQMIGHDTVTVRATPFSESPITTQFPIDGLEEAIDPLRAACNW